MKRVFNLSLMDYHLLKFTDGSKYTKTKVVTPRFFCYELHVLIKWISLVIQGMFATWVTFVLYIFHNIANVTSPTDD